MIKFVSVFCCISTLLTITLNTSDNQTHLNNYDNAVYEQNLEEVNNGTAYKVQPA